MNTKRKHHPLLWIPTLSAAEEIPTAVITFVSLLMFLQFGAGMTMSALYSSLLFLPFVLKSFMRSKVRSMGYFKKNLHINQGLVFVLLMILELSIHYLPNKVWLLFIINFAMAMLCAWHDLLGRMYYDRMLYPRQQKVFNKTKIFASQATVIVTYGVLVIFVGFLEVMFRMPTEIQTKRLAWAMECYIVAGGFLVFFLANFLLLKNPRIHNPYRYESMKSAFQSEIRIIERIRQKDNALTIIVALFFLLLPQSLMFFTRVFFLLAQAREGGMECSIQEVGFAQGTIGVMAFGIGLIFGRYLISVFGAQRMFWFMAVPLALSPVFYMFMAYNPLVDNMCALCMMCFFAQLNFGFGLNICTLFIQYISGERYRNTVSYLYIPLIAGLMIVPMALSGWLCELLGYSLFFIINAASAPFAWLFLYVFKIRQKLIRVNEMTVTKNVHGKAENKYIHAKTDMKNNLETTNGTNTETRNNNAKNI